MGLYEKLYRIQFYGELISFMKITRIRWLFERKL